MRYGRSPAVVALFGALILIAAACSDDEGGAADDIADGDCTWTIGTMGALSGDAAALGTPIAQGVEYAIDQANEAGSTACELVLVSKDTGGDAARAPKVAEGLVGNDNLVFCACPYFSGEVLAAGALFADAGIPLSGTGTDDAIGEQGFRTWFGAVSSDDTQAQVAADYISGALKAERVAVVHDGQDYSSGFADVVLAELGAAAVGPFVLDLGSVSYAGVVAEVKAANPDLVYYGGYTADAGPLARQLREAGVTAQFMSGSGSKDPSFGELAGPAAEGALVTCPCADPLKIEAAQEFVDGMRAEFGKGAPGTLATEIFDVTSFVIEKLAQYEGEPGDIAAVRAHLVAAFRDEEGHAGLAQTYRWGDSGEFAGGPQDIWIYEWSDAQGRFDSIGPAADLIGQ